MRKRSPTALLLVCAALCLACESDRGLEPEPSTLPEPPSLPEPPAEPDQSVLTILDLRPAVAALLTVAPGNTLQLTVYAYDRAGALMDTGAAAYSSSAPEIAGVSSSGFVTAVAPGTTEITVSLTLGGITRTASTTVAVQDRDYSGTAGDYDLTALITSYDDAWGSLESYRYTAVLTLEEQSGPPWFVGTYADLKLIGPNGDSYDVADSGPVSGSIAHDGRVLIDLLGDGNSIDVTLIVDTVASGVIDGTFGCCGHIGGTFRAVRR